MYITAPKKATQTYKDLQYRSTIFNYYLFTSYNITLKELIFQLRCASKHQNLSRKKRTKNPKAHVFLKQADISRKQ